MTKGIYTSLLSPVITEKAAKMSEGGKYVFYIAPHTTKNAVKSAIKKAYGVDVEKVNILKRVSKGRFGKNKFLIEKRQACTKAIVTLKDKKALDLNNIK